LDSLLNSPVSSQQDMSKLDTVLSNQQWPIRPSDIAQQEYLIFPASIFHEKMVKTWSTLHISSDSPKSSRSEVIERIIRQAKDKKYRPHVAIYCATHQRPANHPLDGVVSSASRILRRFKGEKFPLLVSYADPASKKIFSLEPQLLIHSAASSEEVFYSLLVLYRCIYLFEQRLLQRSKTYLASSSVTDRTSYIQDGAQLMSRRTIEELLVAAEDYIEQHYHQIRQVVEQAGWDVKKFSFGPLRHRVEWS
jgi:hypothetical protein